MNSSVGRVADHLLIDPENGVELARLLDQHSLITDSMGGLFPRALDASEIERALDLACGPGGWVLDVAFTHQDMEVIGVDSSRTVIEYARSMGGVQGLDNARYCVMDIREPLKFANGFFDFIQGRFLATSLEAKQRPALLAECKRLLRPGGFIRLVEAEWPDTNSPAVQSLGKIVTQALQLLGRSYDPTGQRLGVVAELVPLLHDAGFAQVASQVHEIPFTTGAIGLHPFMERLRMALFLMEPSLLRLNVTTKEQFEGLLEQMVWEALGDDFRGSLCTGDAWGRGCGKGHQG